MVKKKTLSWYKKKLWEVFSRYIRIRDKGTCFTCGLKKPYKQMQAGHYIPKSIGRLSLYFHEQNVHCQCYRCNINLGGNGALYGFRILEVYGQEVYDELHRLQKHGHRKIIILEYQILTKSYEAKVKWLLQEKDNARTN